MFLNSLRTEPARADLLCLGQEHRHSWDAVPGPEGVTHPAWGDLAHPANPFGRSESATISQQLGSQQSTSSFRPPAASGLLLFSSYSRGGRRSPSQHTNSSARLITEQNSQNTCKEKDQKQQHYYTHKCMASSCSSGRNKMK